MSYQVYLTRGASWAENEGFEIPAAEWARVIESDAELYRDEANGPGFVSISETDDQGCNWIDWSEGNLFTGYPSKALQRKLFQLAARLGATLQGEDGEVYATADDLPEPPPKPEQNPGVAQGRPAYERRNLLWKVLMYASIAIAIIAVNVFDL